MVKRLGSDYDSLYINTFNS